MEPIETIKPLVAPLPTVSIELVDLLVSVYNYYIDLQVVVVVFLFQEQPTMGSVLQFK